MLDFEDRYAALLAASAAQTMRALAIRTGYRETTKAGNGGPGCRDTQFLEMLADLLDKGEYSKPQMRAILGEKLGREVSRHKLTRNLDRLLRSGRVKRIGLHGTDEMGEGKNYAIYTSTLNG